MQYIREAPVQSGPFRVEQAIGIAHPVWVRSGFPFGPVWSGPGWVFVPGRFGQCRFGPGRAR